MEIYHYENFLPITLKPFQVFLRKEFRLRSIYSILHPSKITLILLETNKIPIDVD